MRFRQVLLALPLLAFFPWMAQGRGVTLLRTPDHGLQPQAVLDPQGTLHLVYFKGDPNGGDLFYVRRPAGGASFSTPLRVNSRPGSAMAIGTIRGGQVALGRSGRVHVAWNGVAPKEGGFMQAPMLYTRQNDAGSAFEPERDLITSAHGLDGGGSVAADSEGNVFVIWHAPIPGNTNGEAGRAVFVARSTDDGRTFASEQLASPRNTGACGCCGLKAFADSSGNLFALYRGASESVNRDEILLRSRDHGSSFEVLYKHSWKLSSCPMSSAFLSQAGSFVLAAAETHGRVFFIRVEPGTGKVSEPVSPETKGQHPVVVGNARGEVLLAWTEGTAWGKGGAVAWQIYSANGKPLGPIARAEGVPTWSLVSAFADASGNFTLVY